MTERERVAAIGVLRVFSDGLQHLPSDTSLQRHTNGDVTIKILIPSACWEARMEEGRCPECTRANGSHYAICSSRDPWLSNVGCYKKCRICGAKPYERCDAELHG